MTLDIFHEFRLPRSRAADSEFNRLKNSLDPLELTNRLGDRLGDVPGRALEDRRHHLDFADLHFAASGTAAS